MAEDWSSEYLRMIEDCEARERRMSPWEQEFIASLRSQLEAERRPSAKQAEVLDNIWEKVTAR
jgi:hypothetical protein